MNKFYCFNDLEVAKWYIPPTIEGIRITKESLNSKFELRHEIQQWVNKNCQERVWVLNNLTHVEKIIAVWFENNEDKTLFMLTWSNDIEVLNLI